MTSRGKHDAICVDIYGPLKGPNDLGSPASQRLPGRRPDPPQPARDGGHRRCIGRAAATRRSAMTSTATPDSGHHEENAMTRRRSTTARGVDEAWHRGVVAVIGCNPRANGSSVPATADELLSLDLVLPRPQPRRLASAAGLRERQARRPPRPRCSGRYRAPSRTRPSARASRRSSTRPWAVARRTSWLR